MPRLTLALALCVLSLGAESGANSTNDGAVERFCAEMFLGGCDFGDHVLLGPSSGGYDGEEAHDDCRTCVQGYQCHSDCGSLMGTAEARGRYEDALAAAEDGDVMRLLSLMPHLAHHVRINESRRSVQLYSCDQGSIIANLPVRDDLLSGIVVE